MTESEINEKTKLPLGWALTILGTISSVVGTGAIAHNRLQTIEHDWQDYKRVAETKSQVDQMQEMKIQKLEITLQGIESSLNRIDARLERMEVKK